MATGAVAMAEQPRGGVRKMNYGQGQGKRRVLGDIGNLIAAPVVAHAKLQNHNTHPTTRGYCAQFLAKAQAESLKPAVVRKPHDHQKPQKVIDISSDEKEMLKAARNLEVTEISSDEEDKAKEEKKPLAAATARKDNKTLTSVLTARSKAACRLTTTKPKEVVIAGIDAFDKDNELAVVEYVEDIYKFYKQAENEGNVGDY